MSGDRDEREGLTYWEFLAECERLCAVTLGLDLDSIFGDWMSWSAWDACLTPAEAVLELFLEQGSHDALIPDELLDEAVRYLEDEADR